MIHLRSGVRDAERSQQHQKEVQHLKAGCTQTEREDVLVSLNEVVVRQPDDVLI